MNILFSAPTAVVKSHIIEVVNNFSELGNEVYLVTLWKDKPDLHPGIRWDNASVRNRHWYVFFNKNIRKLGRVYFENIFRTDNERGKVSLFEVVLNRIIESNQIDLIYERFSVSTGSIQIAKERAIPIILELNGVWPLEAKQKGFSEKYCKESLELQIDALNKATAIRAVSKSIKDFYVQNGVNEEIFHIIGNGVNTDQFFPMDKFQCRKNLRLSEENFIIGFVGSFQPFVGLETSVKAMSYIYSLIPNAQLVIIGPEKNGFGPTRNDLGKLADKLGIKDYVNIRGACKYIDVPQYINAFDICLALRVKGTKGSPLKLHEYMSCGRPIIASRVSESEDLLKVEEIGCGYLFEPENYDDLADKIIRIYDQKNLAIQMGKRGRDYAIEKKSWSKIAGKILELAKKISQN